jgi:alanine racemase
MPRPIAATISISALSHNLDVVRRHLQQTAVAVTAARGTPFVAPSILAVVKAHGYGHGIKSVIQGFARAEGVAVSDLTEAVQCREAGWTGAILLLEGFFEPSDLAVIDHYHLNSVVHNQAQLDMLAQAEFAWRPTIFLKLNTGMNRLGFAPQAYRSAYTCVQQLQQRGIVAGVGKMTHFANADNAQGITEQVDRFQRVAGALPGPVSLANSAALLRYPEATLAAAGHTSWVRPGICLYGASPYAGVEAASFDLWPAMSLRSHVIAVQSLKAGETVGYGSLFTTPTPIQVGVVACGYADGYPRHAGTGTPVVVAGIRTRLLGRVSMDMLAVDLTPIPEVGVGTPVSLWGLDGPSIDEVAQAAGTIGYELMCALAPRVPMQPQW